MNKTLGALVIALLAGGCAHQNQGGQGGAAMDHFGVKEVGSFHIGGRQVTLAGLPEKEIVFTAGAAPFKVNPNGDFVLKVVHWHYR